MLTKHLAQTPTKSKNRRSGRVIMTDEGRALRELRLLHGLTMRKAGELIGVSDSYISHIENGRAEPPKGVYLERFLTVYGGIKPKSFYERVRNLQDQISPADELMEIIPRLRQEKVLMILNLTRNL
jgi:transcriptional regulator with XRE-family HTH domain